MKYLKIACVFIGSGLVAVGHSGMAGAYGQLVGELGAALVALPLTLDRLLGAGGQS